MIIFLYGSDGYRLKENVDTIVGAYRKKHKSGMSHYRFDLGDGDGFDELLSAVKNVSFFDEAKLVIVKDLFSTGSVLAKKTAELINDFKITADPKTVLVFIENRTEKDLQKTDKALFALLVSKGNLVRNIEYLNGTKLSNWIKNKFKESGHNISQPVADLLIDIVGNDSWALANEIEKLSNYSGQTNINEMDVEFLVSRKEDSNIFDLVDAVGNQNKAKAFEMVYRLTNSGHDPHYILVRLVYHFENLLSVADFLENSGSTRLTTSDSSLTQLIAKKCGLHPFVARKAVTQAQKFSKNDLKTKFNLLAGLDISSKNGLVNLEDALYNFVAT